MLTRHGFTCGWHQLNHGWFYWMAEEGVATIAIGHVIVEMW